MNLTNLFAIQCVCEHLHCLISFFSPVIILPVYICIFVTSIGICYELFANKFLFLQFFFLVTFKKKGIPFRIMWKSKQFQFRCMCAFIVHAANVQCKWKCCACCLLLHWYLFCMVDTLFSYSRMGQSKRKLYCNVINCELIKIIRFPSVSKEPEICW